MRSDPVSARWKNPKIWSFDTGKEIYSDVVFHVSASDDGSIIVAGSTNGKVHVFDRSGVLLWKRIAGKYISQVGMSSDGDTIVVGAWDGDIRTGEGYGNACAYDRTGQLLWQHNTGKHTPLPALTPDGSLIAVGTSGGKLLLLNADGGLIWKRDLGKSILEVRLWPDGSKVVAGSWRWIPEPKKRFWRKREFDPSEPTALGHIDMVSADGRPLWNHEIRYAALCEFDIVMSTALSREGSHLLLGSSALESNLHLFDDAGQLLWKWHLDDIVGGVALSDNASTIAAGTDDFELHAYGIQGKKLWQQGTGGDPVHHGCSDFALAVSGDGSLIAGGAGDEDLYLLDRNRNLLLRHKVGARLASATFSRKDSLLVAGSWAGNVIAFDISESKG